MPQGKQKGVVRRTRSGGCAPSRTKPGSPEDYGRCPENVTKVKLMGGEERTRSERGSAIKGNSVGGAFALPTTVIFTNGFTELFREWP